jgi:glycosyltransferase involved in cell wall biosynthesis
LKAFTIYREEQAHLPAILRWAWVRRVGLSARHLHGPKKIAYAPDELVVVCLVRDGRPYIKSFIDHYLSLGAKHIVFLDNDSSDGTVDVAREHERVTLIRSTLPYKNYQFAMKEYLISRFGKGRWSLYVDVDELFDYPYSDVVSLSSLLRYLNEKSYTAVAAQHLDMFSDEALSKRISKTSEEDEQLKELYRLYDISNISREGYRGRFDRRSNMITNDDIKIYEGGIRKTLFGGNLMLTKHPLIFFDGKVRHGDMGFHRIKNARIADFSCVLYHYKLVGGLREQLARDLQEGRYPRVLLPGYTKYHDVLQQNPDIRIRQVTARELGSVNELIDNEFLVVSDEYKRWADAEKGT